MTRLSPRTRRRAWRSPLWAALLLAAGWSTGPALAQTIPARGGLHDDYGRLVLDFETPVGAAITGEGRHVELKFDRPQKLDLAGAASTLKSYITRARLSGDGRTLALDFSAPVTWQAFNDGAKLALDFGFADDAGQRVFDHGPDAANAELAAPSGAAATAKNAAAPAAAAIPTVPLRTGEHPGYSRLAFDWPKDVAYEIQPGADGVTVRFGSPAKIDLEKAAGDLPPRVNALGTAPSENGVAVKIGLKPGMLLRDFRSGRTVVLDVWDPDAANLPPQNKTEAKSPANAAAELQDVPPAIPPTTAPAAATPTETAPGVPLTAQAVLPQPASPQPGTQQPAQPAMQQAAPATPKPPAQQAAALAPQLQSALPEAPVKPAQVGASGPGVAVPVTATPPVAFQPPPSAPPPVEVKVTALPLKGGATLYFDWPKPVALAVFRRGDALWLVFDRPAKGDLKALARVADAIGKAEKVATPFGFALRFKGGAAAQVATATEGARWKITLAPGTALTPSQPLQQRRETLADGATSLYVQAIGSGAEIDLADPGDRAKLSVTPEQFSGLGIARESDWPDFKLLPSYQGVVVELLNDRPQVQAGPNGVVITTPKAEAAPQVAAAQPEAPQPEAQQPETQQAAQQPAAKPEAAKEQPAGEAAQSATENPPSSSPVAKTASSLFDMPAWRRGGEATFFQDLAALKSKAASAAPADRNKARLELAEFYLANGYGPEASGQIDSIRKDDRDADGNPLIMAIGATAKTMAEEYDAAQRMLAAPALQGVAEANLLRAYIAAKRGDAPAAAKLFAGALPDISGYPKRFRTDLRLIAAKALLDQGDPITAQNFLDPLRRDDPDPDTEARTAYLNGLKLLKLGKKEEALKTWEPLADSPIDEVRARAQFEVVQEQLAEKKIEPKDAVAKLEALRYLWRGDTFEFDLLYRLGHLYFDALRPREGLLTLRQAATHFPNHPLAKQAADDMTVEFRKLYLGGGADKLPPVMALGLYDQFRELTPTGPDGDRMIAALADRLVKVDLLDDRGAAGLLSRLVKTRLTGPDKVAAGTRLAAVRLLDDKPDLALQALGDSEGPATPELAAQRQRLKARALFDTGETLQGINLVRDDQSLEGLWTKSDMFWKLREWPSAADALGQLITAEQAKRAAEAAKNDTGDIAKNPASVLTQPPADAPAAPADGQGGSKLDQALAQAQAAAAASGGQPAPTTPANGQPANGQPANAAPAPKPLIDPVLSRLVLNRAVALSLANDRRGLKDLGRSFGKQMDTTALGDPFKVLTSSDTGLTESITAQMKSVDQLGVFVDQYKQMLQSEALSAPLEPSPDTGPLAPMDKPAGEATPTAPQQTAAEPTQAPATP
jgi:hypothetical protein